MMKAPPSKPVTKGSALNINNKVSPSGHKESGSKNVHNVKNLPLLAGKTVSVPVTKKNVHSALIPIPVKTTSMPVKDVKAPVQRKNVLKGQILVPVSAKNITKPKLENIKSKNVSSTSITGPDSKTMFTDYNRGNTTKTFHVVCLTHVNVPYTYITNPKEIITWFAKTWNHTFFSRVCHHRQKIITVYVKNVTEFEMKSSRGTFLDVQVKDLKELPNDYKVVRDQTAYFLKNEGPKEPSNFYHFIKQIYYPLYHLMNRTNQLHSEAQNIVFYPAPYAFCEKDKRVIYHNPDKYKHFRDVLHIKNKLELSAYVDKPDPNKVCYENAVFSRDLFIEDGRGAWEYFKKVSNIRDDVCKPKTLTIINRSLYRKILNVDKLMSIAKEFGYNPKEVLLEKMTIKEQAQLIYCTNVLVGLNGAGLQWAYFMKDNSAVFEIAWPEKEWLYIFTSRNKSE